MAKKLAVIGCGNMGSAIVKGVVASGTIDASEIMVADASAEAAVRLSQAVGCSGTTDNSACVDGAASVLIAVKPQYLDAAVSGLAPALADDALVISIAAGVTLERLGGLVGEGRHIVRVMPNLAAQVGEAMSSVSPNAAATPEDTAYVKALCESFGRAEVVPESLIDAVVGVSGSSPAYVCLFIEALADAGVAEGMSRAQALTFAEQAVLGTARYLIETGTHPAVLKDMVSSPAGTTIDAVAALEADGFRAAVIDAATTAALKNRTM